MIAFASMRNSSRFLLAGLVAWSLAVAPGVHAQQMPEQGMAAGAGQMTAPGNALTGVIPLGPVGVMSGAPGTLVAGGVPGAGGARGSTGRGDPPPFAGGGGGGGGCQASVGGGAGSALVCFALIFLHAIGRPRRGSPLIS